MPRIAILTDSTANIPAEWKEKYNIHTIPLKIHWNGETYRDGLDISPADFYSRLDAKKELPTTSQPAAQEFLQVYEELSGASYGILVILLSSGISGTIASAEAARIEFKGVPVEIVDTGAASATEALVVLAAARLAKEGRSLEEVTRAAREAVRNINTVFAVDTLEYLHKGGRIGGATKFLGTALSIKPLLHFQDGRIHPLERVRTRNKALDRLIELAVEGAKGKPARVGVMHAADPGMAEEVRSKLMEKLDCHESFISELSPVIGTHVGPGTIGISVLAE